MESSTSRRCDNAMLPASAPIQVARWADMVKRLFALKGRDSLAMADKLVAAIVLENDRPEWRRSTGARIGSAAWFVNSGAGVRSAAQLWVPRSSQVLVTIKQLIIGSTTSATAIQWGHSTTALTTLDSTQYHTDYRNSTNAGANLGFACEARSEATAGTKVLSVIGHTAVSGTACQVIPVDVVLTDRYVTGTAGLGFVMQPSADNVNLWACLLFEERPRDSTADA